MWQLKENSLIVLTFQKLFYCFAQLRALNEDELCVDFFLLIGIHSCLPIPTKQSTVYRPFYGRPTITFRTLYRGYWLDTCVRIFDVQIYRLYNVGIYRNNTECK